MNVRETAVQELLKAVDPANGVGEYRLRIAYNWIVERGELIDREIFGLTAKLTRLEANISTLEKKRDRLNRRKA